MRYVCTTPATVTPIAVADVLAHSRIDAHDDDAYIAGLIAKATRAVERELDRQFCMATWKLYMDEFPAEIVLGKCPVATITSITYTDTAGSTQTLASANYQSSLVSPDSPGRIRPAYGLVWPATRGDTYDAVCVTFTAGYGVASAVPQSVKHALCLLVAHWYENREPTTGEGSQQSIQFALDYLLSKEDWGVYA
jgi:uncharacterized phiE125 gp8 family phage protein